MIKKASKDNSPKLYEQLAEVLGREYLGHDIESRYDYITLATEGINAYAIRNFRSHFNLDRGFVAAVMQVSEPTLYRWIKSQRKLHRNQSLILLELTDLFNYGSEVFANSEGFFQWLKLSAPSFGGMSPAAMLELPGGIGEVRDLLGRIEYGVYS